MDRKSLYPGVNVINRDNNFESYFMSKQEKKDVSELTEMEILITVLVKINDNLTSRAQYCYSLLE